MCFKSQKNAYRKPLQGVLTVMSDIAVTALSVWFTLQAAAWAGMSVTLILRIQLLSQPLWVSSYVRLCDCAS